MKRVYTEDDLRIASKFMMLDVPEELYEFMAEVGKLNLKRLAEKGCVDLNTYILLRLENKRIKKGVLHSRLTEEIQLKYPVNKDGVNMMDDKIIYGNFTSFHGVLISSTNPPSYLKILTDQVTGKRVNHFRSLSFRHGNFMYGKPEKTGKGPGMFHCIEKNMRYYKTEFNGYGGLIMENFNNKPRLLKDSKKRTGWEVTMRGTLIKLEHHYLHTIIHIKKKNGRRYDFTLKEINLFGLECIEYDETKHEIIYWEYTNKNAKKYVVDLRQVEKYLVRLALRDSSIPTDLFPKIVSYLTDV